VSFAIGHDSCESCRIEEPGGSRRHSARFGALACFVSRANERYLLVTTPQAITSDTPVVKANQTPNSRCEKGSQADPTKTLVSLRIRENS